MHDTLVPVASTGSIGTTLFVEIVQIVYISPFIRFTTACQAERYPFELHIAPFLPVEFAGPFVHDIPNVHGPLIQFGTFCALAHGV
ncbi:hypothetical protein D3C81_1960950 [compost metagenome]